MATVNENLNINISGGEEVKKLKEQIEELQEELTASSSEAGELRRQLKQLGNEQTKKGLENISNAIKEIANAQKTLSDNAASVSKASEKSITSVDRRLAKMAERINSAANLMEARKKALEKDFRIAETTLDQVAGNLSNRQLTLLDRKLGQFGTGELSLNQYRQAAKKISKVYSEAFAQNIDKSTLTNIQRQAIRDEQKHAINLRGADRKDRESEAKIENERLVTEEKIAEAREKAAEKLKEEIQREKDLTEERRKQNEYATDRARSQADRERVKVKGEEANLLNKQIKTAKTYRAAQEYIDALDAKALRRKQKLEQNERARATLYKQLGEVMTGSYDDTSKATQKAELASKRLLETMRHIQEFAATKGYTGTVGLESTDVLRAQQYYNTIMQVAIEWKRNNSEEGKAADMLSRMLVDAEGFRSGVNRIHTALGQVASTISAITGIAKQFRQTIDRIAQPVLQMITRITSSAFKSALEALKNIELSEIGFGNFFGTFEVPGIMSNIKQNALLSPLSAAQLANYVNQIAPLSNGNSTLAVNAAMGVAKMIQYSGGEVSTEMEYVIRNLRDVISKGESTKVDIRQFNRAMPALKKVLQDMGLEEFLKNGELTVTKENANKLLEAFQKINESEDVGSIFEKTSTTISGLMERLQEQIELLIIDVSDFAGATDWIKQTLSDILDDSDGWLTNIKYYLSFVGNDIMRWVKSRDWEYFANNLKDIFEVVRGVVVDGISAIKESLGGSDTATTIREIAKALSEFLKGILNSYSWLINLVRDMSRSGLLGSGILQAGMGIMGFLSGNAGTLITGLTRGAGNFMGVFNQTITSAINTMKAWQAKLLEAATTVNGFDEAIILASKASADLAADFALMQQIMSGTMSQEQAKQAMMEIEARSRDRLIEAQIKNIASEEAETAANNAATQSELAESGANATSASVTGGGGILAAMFGKGTSGGTKFGAALGTLGKGLIGTLIAGMLGDLLGGGFGSLISGGNKYVSSATGSAAGNLAGGAVAGGTLGSLIAPGIGTAIGAIVGGVGGIVKTVFDIKGIMDDKRKDELEAIEAEINSGEYIRELLSKTTEGLRVTSGDFDKINSAAVKLMHNFNDAFPNGTADALLTFLGEMEYNGRTLNEMIAASNKTREQNANDLWDAIKNETIDEESGEYLANEIAAALYDAGYDNSDIVTMVLEKATAAFNNNEITMEKLLDVMTQWSSVQTTSGEDLSRESLLDLKTKGEGGDSAAMAKYNMYVTQLNTLFRDVMANVLKDLPEDVMTDTEKTALSAQMAQTWVDIITGSLDKANKDGIFSLTWLFQQAGIDASNNPFNLGITDDDVAALDNYKIKLFGINNNWDTWSKKVYKFGENVTWYTDTIKNKMDEFYGVITPTANELRNLTDAVNKLGESAKNASTDIRNQTSNPWSMPLTPGNPFVNKANGGIVYKAAGGGVRGVDTVPAMLQSGEFVVRRSAVNKVGLSAMNALNTGNLGYFARAMGRQNIYGDYSNARTWNNTSNDNRKSVSNIVKVYNNSKGARLNRYYSLANRLA